jgi:hypothetical protein
MAEDGDIRALKVPVRCGNCSRYVSVPVGELIDNVVGACSHCASALDFETDEWAEFRTLLRALVALGGIPAAPVKEQS